jgi:hypothetical protein
MIPHLQRKKGRYDESSLVRSDSSWRVAAPSRAPMPPAQQVKEKKEMRYQSCDQPDTKRKKKAQGRERRMKAVDGDRMVGEVLRRPH